MCIQVKFWWEYFVNLGLSGSGGLIRNDKGHTVLSNGGRPGQCSNNEVELMTLDTDLHEAYRLILHGILD